MSSWQRQFVAEQRLPDDYVQTASRFFDPLAAELARQRQTRGAPLLIGVNGSQGSGKSTLCDYLCHALQEDHGFGAIALSLDDFYLTHQQRQTLAREIHPLLATRGVPGTHDIPLLQNTLDALLTSSGEAQVPRFDKATDDRFPESQWTRLPAPVDVVFIEGWCLGARVEDESSLLEPLNDLERSEDSQGHWRRFVNQALMREHEPLYQRIDTWVMLKAPNFECVLRWRSEQEQKLRLLRGNVGTGLMDEVQLARFVAHFERLTRQCLEQLPDRVHVLFELDDSRQLVAQRGLEISA